MFSTMLFGEKRRGKFPPSKKNPKNKEGVHTDFYQSCEKP